jgi:hypothetical protein
VPSAKDLILLVLMEVGWRLMEMSREEIPASRQKMRTAIADDRISVTVRPCSILRRFKLESFLQSNEYAIA